MSEIAKCPACGKDVKKSIWHPEYEGCAGSVVITVKCCGMEAIGIELWNQYAAAMELAKAEAVLDASSTKLLFLQDGTQELDDWSTSHRQIMKRYMAAKDRVLEVFGK